MPILFELSARCAAWERARERLGQALRAAGRDQAEAAAIVARLKAARQGKPADELAVYDEVKGLYAGLVQDGRKEFESDLVALCGEKALVHMRAGDAPGAIQEYNQAIAIQERLIKQESRRDLIATHPRIENGTCDTLGNPVNIGIPGLFMSL